jgi:hypothetical protein
MKKKKHPITTNYKKIRLYLKEGRIKEAEELLNWGIARLANISIEGIKVIDKVDVNLWKDRYWFELENHGLLEGADIEPFEFENIEDDGRETW